MLTLAVNNAHLCMLLYSSKIEFSLRTEEINVVIISSSITLLIIENVDINICIFCCFYVYIMIGLRKYYKRKFYFFFENEKR